MTVTIFCACGKEIEETYKRCPDCGTIVPPTSAANLRRYIAELERRCKLLDEENTRQVARINANATAARQRDELAKQLTDLRIQERKFLKEIEEVSDEAGRLSRAVQRESQCDRLRHDITKLKLELAIIVLGQYADQGRWMDGQIWRGEGYKNGWELARTAKEQITNMESGDAIGNNHGDTEGDSQRVGRSDGEESGERNSPPGSN